MKSDMLKTLLWLLLNATYYLGIVIARVLMDKQTQEAFEIVFGKVFSAVKSKHPLFQPGKTLRGILTDWSDTQRALSTVLGEELATELCKGCKVCYIAFNYILILLIYSTRFTSCALLRGWQSEWPRVQTVNNELLNPLGMQYQEQLPKKLWMTCLMCSVAPNL